VESRVEPLGRVRRRDLRGEHVADLVIERLRVDLGVEVVMRATPVRPRAGEAVEDFTCIPFTAEHRPSVAVEHGPAIRAGLGHARLAEILLGEDVRRHRRPARGHGDALLAKDRGPIRVLDLRCAEIELDPGVWAVAFLGVAAGDLHAALLTAVANGRC
jgi:hypothetical protein